MPATHTAADLLPYEQAQRQRAMLLKLVRAAFAIVFCTVALLALLATDLEGDRVKVGPVALRSTWQITLVLGLIFGGLAVLVDVLTPQKKISTLAGIFVGLLTAMLLAVATGIVIDLLVALYDIRDADGGSPDFVLTGKLLIGIGLGYVCISTVLQTQDDFRLVIPYVEFAKQLRGPRPLLLDSSTLIDARLIEVARTGVLQAPLIVPRFVLEELQTLADSSDATKRTRGRRGLESVASLQRAPQADLTIDETQLPSLAVDQALVELASRIGGFVATTDAALRSVAEIQSIPVFSVHDLAAAMKPVALPGERFVVTLVRPGEQPGQAVGYLDDGTMVVVNDAAPAIGSALQVDAESTIPTAAGRILFARPTDPGQVPAERGPQNMHEPEPVAPEPVVPEPAAPEPAEAEPAEPEPSGQSGVASSSRPPHGPRTSSRAAARRNPRR
ncbi:MAG: PIN/TRAM domain-containing protein [Planctomycetota bacterium]